MQQDALEVGDMIRINRPGYSHVGIFVGNTFPDGRNVVHNSKGGGVVLSTLSEFSGRSDVYLHKKAQGNYFERKKIAQRALSLLGRQYDLWKFNCEHLANYAQSGQAISPQLTGVALLTLVVGGLTLLAMSDA